MEKLNKEQEFMIFCLEAYKNAKKITGKAALNEFERYEVFEYLETAYDILHSQSMTYITDEINEFIKNKK